MNGPTTTHGGRERQGGSQLRARATDERLLDAALRTIVAEGVDALSLSKVAASIGLTSGASYARYSNAGELAADVWERRLRDRVAPSIERAIDALRRPDADLGAMVDELLAPSDDLTAAVHLMAAALHVLELGDVVPRDLTSWLNEYGCGPSAPREARLQGYTALGMLFGTVLTRPTLALERWEFEHYLPLLRAATMNLPPSSHLEPVLPRWMPTTTDPIEAALSQSAREVIAQVGAARASLSRVARRAGHSPSTIYSISSNRSEFFARVFERSALSQAEDTSLPRMSIDWYAALNVGWMRPEATVLRRFSLEAALTAMHDSLVRRVVRVTLDRWIGLVATAADAEPEAHAHLAEFVLRVGRLIQVGTYVLQEHTGMLTDADWPALVRAIARETAAHPSPHPRIRRAAVPA